MPNKSKKNKSEHKFNQDDILNILNAIYDKACDGISHVSKPIEEFAEDYISKNQDIEKAIKSMLNNQVAKCTTSGFITGFGGVITLPVSIPANLSSVLYVQMRMIACTAYMAGYDLSSDQVQTFVYACLAGVSVNEVFKKFGIAAGTKFTTAAVNKIPGKVLVAINQKVGFRFLTKWGEKGLINIGKLIPVVGAVINGSLDLVETKIIANRAYKMFIKGDLSMKADKNEDIIDVEIIDIDNIEIIDDVNE